MPRPDERERPGPTPPKERVLAPEQVRLTLARGGDVVYAGDTYPLGSQDPEAAAKAATDLRAALMKAHEARGGDAFREADGRSKLVLLVRSGGDLDPSALHRLLEATKQPPLRATRVEFDLGAR